MKIVLVFPPFYLEAMYNLPPLGLINLATALKDSSHQVVLMDLVLAVRKNDLKMGKGIYDDCADIIMGEAPDVVGFSAQCTTYPGVIQISKKIRNKSRDVKIVIGGHNASFVDRLTLEAYPFVNAIVRGEGEITFRELITAYQSGHDEKRIPGVTYRRGEKFIRNEERDLIADLDELPLPDYGFLPPLHEYRDACQIPRSIAILEVGRGCPHRCIYCSESILWRRRTRTFSIGRLVEEMGNLHRNFGAECFLLAYDQFTARRGFVETFCHQVIEKGLNHLPWYCISRLDSVDSDLLALMREAGCESMCYGVDSGSKRTLAFIRKNIDHKILYERVKETADQGIIPTLSFVIGFPEEGKADIDETLVLALRAGIVGNNNPLIQMPTVLPGTDLHKRYGDRLVRRVDTYFALGIEFDKGRRIRSDEELINSSPLIFSSFYNLPCPARPLEELNLIANTFPLIARFYPKTFLLLSIENHESVSDLFIRWLKWLRERLKIEEISLSPRDCYLHFRDFASDLFFEKENLMRKHLPEILKYENIALEVGKFGNEKESFSIDFNNIHEFKPMRSKKIVVEKFDIDLPMVILDLKQGDFKESYPVKESFLVFKQDRENLDINEINLFTRDFLGNCNGESTLQTISLNLHERYGENMRPEDFFDSCVDAVQILGENGFIISDQTIVPIERR